MTDKIQEKGRKKAEAVYKNIALAHKILQRVVVDRSTYGIVGSGSALINMINVKNKVYKNGYRRRSCTSKNSLFRQICNVLYLHYSASSILLST